MFGDMEFGLPHKSAHASVSLRSKIPTPWQPGKADPVINHSCNFCQFTAKSEQLFSGQDASLPVGNGVLPPGGGLKMPRASKLIDARFAGNAAAEPGRAESARNRSAHAGGARQDVCADCAQ